MVRAARALAAVAVLVAANAATAATPTVRPPARWAGTVGYSYEQVDGNIRQRATMTATVTLGHVTKGYRARDPWSYVAKAGTIRWVASGSRPECTWSSSGSRKIGRNDLFLELSRYDSGPRFRATFAAPDELLVKATETCTYGGASTTSEVEYGLGHPFAVLGRITSGVAVDDRLSAIRGSKPGSQNIGATHTLRWRSSWSFGSRR